MKILVHFHFCWKLKTILQPIFQNSFFIFWKNENYKDFSISFFKFRKKWKWNEIIFEFSKKMEILFLSSLFNFGEKKWKLTFFCKFNFHCFFNVFTWTTTWRRKCANHAMLASAANITDRDPAEHMVVNSRGEEETTKEG